MSAINTDLFEESLNELRVFHQNHLIQQQKGDITIPQETALCLLAIIDLFANNRFDSLDLAQQNEMLYEASKLLKHKALNVNSRLSEKDLFKVLSLIVTDF